jgi:hypothetical protein
MLPSPEGTVYAFSLLDEESMRPCFRLAFETREGAEQGRSMMTEIIEHCLFFEIPDDTPDQPEPGHFLPPGVT